MIHPLPNNIPWLHDRTILYTVHGSHAYGLQTPESDVDYKGVCVPPQAYFHGFLQRFEQSECSQPDSVIYDIRKFFSLAANGNPNILEMLWVSDQHRLLVPNMHARCAGNSLLGIREFFLSKKILHTFSGYAFSQLKRIRTHRKWLLNPPKNKPERKDFNLPEASKLSKDQMGAITTCLERGESYPADIMTLYHRERAYHNALVVWQQYCQWKLNRNPKRHHLEEKFGYDCKHAMHLVRLMRMCREILITGRVLVLRPDKKELLAIRNGAWEYDQLMEWANQQDAELNKIAMKSILPNEPDKQLLDLHCRLIVERMLQ